jgi:hypothetical protein
MSKKSKRSSWLRLALVAAAIAAVLLVASGASLWHYDAPGSEATCPICHLAHMPVLSGAPSALLFALAPVAWIAPVKRRVADVAPAASDFPPRAPPV